MDSLTCSSHKSDQCAFSSIYINHSSFNKQTIKNFLCCSNVPGSVNKDSWQQSRWFQQHFLKQREPAEPSFKGKPMTSAWLPVMPSHPIFHSLSDMEIQAIFFFASPEAETWWCKLFLRPFFAAFWHTNILFLWAVTQRYDWYVSFSFYSFAFLFIHLCHL